MNTQACTTYEIDRNGTIFVNSWEDILDDSGVVIARTPGTRTSYDPATTDAGGNPVARDTASLPKDVQAYAKVAWTNDKIAAAIDALQAPAFAKAE